MGEIADMMIDGTMCQQCGEYLGEATGYPRYCNSCRPKNRKNPNPSKGKDAIKGVKNFLISKGIDEREWDLICAEYSRPVIGVDSTREQRCEFIQADFGKFVKWFRKHKEI